MNKTLDFLTMVANVATSIGVGIAAWQLWVTRRQAVTTFEDSLAREYRELAAQLPNKIFLDGDTLSDEDYHKVFDKLYQYFDFSNEQVFLRQIGRIRKSTWIFWRDGIRSNVKRAVFSKAWADIDRHIGGDFRELRRLIETDFEQDPRDWSQRKGRCRIPVCIRRCIRLWHSGCGGG
jgi:hypothetical protein